MRHVTMLALMSSAVALSACAGGGGGGGTALTLASTLSVCSIGDTSAACNPDSSDGSGSGSGSDGSGTDGSGSGGSGADGDGTAGTGDDNIGNDVSLSTGDTTLILEKSKLANDIDEPALSRLTYNTAGRAQIEIDTKQPDAEQSLWPVPKYMKEYAAGSTYDDPFIVPDHLGGTYKEYRALSYNEDGTSADEVLQVWTFGSSYATQYRDLADGGEAAHQAWSFGGTKTTAASMPVAGTVNYSGRFGATAKTWNWEDPSNGRTVSINNLWRVTGATAATADFGTGAFTATLTPEAWNAYATLNGGSGFTDVDAGNPADPNWNAFMDDTVNISGTITTSASGNAITGTAEMELAQGWVTNETVNPFYGAFFGPGAAEVTGVFNLEAIGPYPIGGDSPISDDHRGFMQMSGAIHAQ